MTTHPARPRHPGPLVTAVLVCHDGADWLPVVLEALAAQTRAPERFVAVDTGSTDGSPDLVAATFGREAVVTIARGSSLGTALRAGLAAFDGRSDTTDAVEWLWILHDDCAPEPSALERLLERVAASPSISMAGPKVHDWDGALLVEAGLTVDAGGHVDSGLESPELDQGQRDDVDDVLAVGTAAALLRRDVWESVGGIDEQFPLYGEDIDLGWRINAGGGRVVVASDAVVRHVGALRGGQRRPDAVTGRAAVVDRRHQLQVVLANTAGVLVPLLVVRYVVGGALRALSLLLLARRPAAALTELRAVVGLLPRSGTILSARRARRPLRHRRHRELRQLFPRPGTRWRHMMAATGLGRGGTAAWAEPGSHESGPVDEESQSLAAGDSAATRLRRRPALGLFLVLALLALIADRHLFSTTLHGGRLLPAPQGARELWSTYLDAWHPVSVGSTTPAPTSLAVLAALSTIALGKVWVVVDVLLLGTVPLAAASAFTALRSLTGTVRIRVWLSLVYALLPTVTGATAGGRIDVAVAAILLPQVLRACAAAVRADPGAHGWHRSVGAGLLLALLVAFVPVLWIASVGVVAAVLLVATASGHRPGPRRALSCGWLLLVPPVVLIPWSLHVVRQPSLLLSGSGLPESFTSASPPSGWSLALLHPGGPAQPAIWVTAAVLAAAMLGLRRTTHVMAARVGVVIYVMGLALAIAETREAGVSAGLPASRYWPGAALLLAGCGALLAAAVAAVAARPALRRQSFGWQQPAAVGLVLLAVVSTATLAGTWLVRGAGGPLSGDDPVVVPLFAQSELAVPTSPRGLVIRAGSGGLAYTLVRRPTGPQLGDAEVAPDLSGDRGERNAAAALRSAVRDLAAGRPGAGRELSRFGVGYVIVPSTSVPRLAAALGRSGGLTRLPAPGASVWRSAVPAGELTVLPSGAAAAGSDAAASGVAAPVAAAAGHAAVTIPSGADGRVAVLAEPVDSHWRATIGGHRLPGRTAYGWAQAFDLPASGGSLQVSFHDPRRHLLLALELALLAVALLLAVPARAVPQRRTP